MNDQQRTVYRRIVHDKRIKHGAFRLWHYLHGRRNKADLCWPAERTIARDIGCKTHSLSNWIQMLVACGYLNVHKTGQNHHHKYQILYGDGFGVLPEWATRERPKEGDLPAISCSPNGNGVLPERASPRDAQKGDGSNNNEVKTRGNKKSNWRQRWQIEKDIKSVKEQIERHKLDRQFWFDQHRNKRWTDKLTPEAQEKIDNCRLELKRLESELDELLAAKTTEEKLP